MSPSGPALTVETVVRLAFQACLLFLWFKALLLVAVLAAWHLARSH